MEMHSDSKGKMSRRVFLRGAGVALGLAACGGVWRAEEQGVFAVGEGAAFAPWVEWPARGTGPQVLVAAAILAANAHNTQPWRFRVRDQRIDLLADTTRDIGTIDPFARERDIGLGCALENLLLAARARGYTYQLSLAPDTADRTLAARVQLAPGGADVSPLYAAIPHRRTNRFAYDTVRPVAQATLDALGQLGADDPDVTLTWFASEGQRASLGGLLVEAARAINDDAMQSYDNGERWTRLGQEAIERYRDGLTLDTMGLEPLTLFAAKLLPSPSSGDSASTWLDTEINQTKTAAAFGIIVIRDYSDLARRLRAGRLWQRLHLWMTDAGLAAQPLNQLHERADRETQLGLVPRFSDALAQLVGDPTRRGLFTFRLGYPTITPPPSPRRASAEVII